MDPMNIASNDTSQSDPTNDPKTQNDPPQQNSADPAANPSEKTYSEKELKELLEKARSDEKGKVFSKIEAAKTEKEKLEAAMKALEETKAQIEKDRDALREGRATELKSVNDELAQLRKQNENLQAMFDASIDTAAKQLREYELKAYKAQKIQESGIKFVETISGDSEQEIDASINMVKTREQEIREMLKEEIRKEQANDLPAPINTDGSYGRGPTPTITPQNRQAVAQLKGDDYAKRRAQLLEEARIKAGQS